MDTQDLLRKLAQIEEQAKDTLHDFPHLAKERLRMIVALAHYVRTEIAEAASAADAGLREDQVDDSNAGNA